MKTRLIAATLVMVAAAAGNQAAAQALKPGLWDIRQSAPNGSGQAMAEQMARIRKDIAAMPAEQRKQMESLMAATDNNQVQFTDKGMSLKACVTADDAARLENLVVKDGNCTMQRSPLVAGQIKMNISCTSPPSTGNGTIRFQGDTGYEMDVTMTSKVQGQTRTNKMSSTGKWLGSDCGKVKPFKLDQPQRK